MSLTVWSVLVTKFPSQLVKHSIIQELLEKQHTQKKAHSHDQTMEVKKEHTLITRSIKKDTKQITKKNLNGITPANDYVVTPRVKTRI